MQSDTAPNNASTRRLENNGREQLPEPLHLNRKTSQNGPLLNKADKECNKTEQSSSSETIFLVKQENLKVVSTSESEPDLML